MRGYIVRIPFKADILSDEILEQLIPPPIIYPGVPHDYNVAILRKHYSVANYDIEYVRRADSDDSSEVYEDVLYE
jgi:hypothetical protein